MLEVSWNLLSGDMKAIFRIAELNLDALNTVDLGPKRPFNVGGCALWARLTGPQLAAQVAAVASLVEASANHRIAPTVAKEVMAIMLGNKTGLSIEKFSESPFAGTQPKLINTSTEAAAAEAAVTAKSSQVKLILSPKQRAKPKTSAQKTGRSIPYDYG